MPRQGGKEIKEEKGPFFFVPSPPARRDAVQQQNAIESKGNITHSLSVCSTLLVCRSIVELFITIFFLFVGKRSVFVHPPMTS